VLGLPSLAAAVVPSRPLLEHWLAAGFTRLLVGYPVVIAIRIVGKSLLTRALAGCGVDVKEGASNERPRSSDQAGAALVKVKTYFLCQIKTYART
jgi:hypothetical protein